MLCRDCGHVPQCPNCDISLTYHKTTDQLKCHYCGYEETPSNQCPNCESEHIRQMGTGTQRLKNCCSKNFRMHVSYEWMLTRHHVKVHTKNC